MTLAPSYNLLTPQQQASLTPQQELVFSTISPLVLDLTGAGIQTVGIGQAGVNFDLNNSGVNASVGWITPGEGFLVDLPAGATTITNGSELFGTATVLPNGQTASNGFAALAAFDANGNGVINANDPIFNQLQVWVDTGKNGNTPTGKLFSLAELNIQSLNLKATVSNQTNNGNTIGLISSYTTTSGQTYELADVWLSSTDASASTASQMAQALSEYAANNSITSNGAGVTSVVPTLASPSSSVAATLGGSSTPSSSGNVSTTTVALTNALGNAVNEYSQPNTAGSLGLTPSISNAQLGAPNTPSAEALPLSPSSLNPRIS